LCNNVFFEIYKFKGTFKNILFPQFVTFVQEYTFNFSCVFTYIFFLLFLFLFK
jgi:hypothetical protein